MAEIEYDRSVDARSYGEQPSGGVKQLINFCGTAASLFLVAGIGVWGYELVMRDVSGVPVVRAIEGPMRVQPENPGGEPADHQGLAVNAVAAQGVASPPAEQLLLAPKPVELAEEDRPMGQLGEEEDVVEGEVVIADTGEAPDIEEQSVDALVERLLAGVQAEEEGSSEDADDVADGAVRPELLDTADADDLPNVETAVFKGPGLNRSLRPQVRPAVMRLASAQPAVVTPAVARDVDPSTLAPGTQMAQLGAFESPEVAREEWDRLVGQFEDYLGNKGRIIQEAESGGRIFYRLRAEGFDDLSDARRFCSVLVAENADCIPVTVR